MAEASAQASAEASVEASADAPAEASPSTMAKSAMTLGAAKMALLHVVCLVACSTA